MKPENVWKGALFIALAATAYAFMGVFVKFGKNIPDTQLVFFRNFICLLVLFPLLLIPKPKELKTSVAPIHLLRAGAGLLNMYCFFFSLRYIILADAMLLNNTMPLFVPLVLWIWKREKVPLKIVPGLIIGFVGILLILRPGAGIFKLASLLALLSGIFMSISMAGTRELGKIEPLYRILFYYFFLSSIISFPFLFLFSFAASWRGVGILLGIGLSAVIYQLFLTQGYQFAPATKISPILYLAVILSGFFDWLFWGMVPPPLSYAGVFLVVVGAIICVMKGDRAKT